MFLSFSQREGGFHKTVDLSGQGITGIHCIHHLFLAWVLPGPDKGKVCRAYPASICPGFGDRFLPVDYSVLGEGIPVKARAWEKVLRGTWTLSAISL